MLPCLNPAGKLIYIGANEPEIHVGAYTLPLGYTNGKPLGHLVVVHKHRVRAEGESGPAVFCKFCRKPVSQCLQPV